MAELGLRADACIQLGPIPSQGVMVLVGLGCWEFRILQFSSQIPNVIMAFWVSGIKNPPCTLHNSHHIRKYSNFTTIRCT